MIPKEVINAAKSSIHLEKWVVGIVKWIPHLVWLLTWAVCTVALLAICDLGWNTECIAEHVPETGFYTLMAGFLGLVVSVAIPQGINAVTRISDRYGSQLLANRFLHDSGVRVIHYLMIPLIAISGILAFYGSDLSWNIRSVLVAALLSGGLLSFLLFFRFIGCLVRYTEDIKFILADFYEYRKKLLR